MNAVIGDMNVSTGGVLRIGKSVQELLNIKPGDRIVMLQDSETLKITFQIQRGYKIIALLEGAELVIVEKD